MECITTQSAGRFGALDEANVDWCRERGLVIVTHDDDYLKFARGRDHTGIAYCRRGKYKTAGLISALILLAVSHSAEYMVGRVEFI